MSIEAIGTMPMVRDTAANRRRRIQGRILAILTTGDPAYRIDPSRRLVVDGWQRAPGAAPCWRVRQRVGGSFGPEEFRAAVDDLIARGRLVEVWCDLHPFHGIGHQLVLPGCRSALRRPVTRAVGRADRIAAEYADLG